MKSGSLACLTLLLLGCAARPGVPDADGPGPKAPWPDAEHPVLRVGGDLLVQTRAESATKSGESLVIYRCDPCLVDTPLPEGYPPPTPPGAIELKRYPPVRRAEMHGARNPNLAFIPLLAHITSRKIAMTSPVEMDYAEDPQSGATRETMSFLYRRPEQGPLGTTESEVIVRDLPETHVLSLGVRGAFGPDAVEQALGRLRTFLAAHPEWTEAGPPRSLEYNSPFVQLANRWSEVQLPVTPKP